MPETKFKIGDRVQIIPYDELLRLVDSGTIPRLDEHGGPGWNADMNQECGSVIIITRIMRYLDHTRYKASGNNKWSWREDWLRPAILHINIMD